MKKRLFCWVLAICMVFCNAAALELDANTAFEETNSARYEQITVMSPYLTISSSGYATCSCMVSLRPGYNVQTTTTLYKLVNGIWDDVHSWTHSGSGVSGVNVDDGIQVDHGTYIVEISAYVTNSSGHYVETATAQSRSVTY